MKELKSGKITTTSERLKEVMQKKGWKQIDIVNAAQPYCKKYGVKLGRNDISQYISGKVEPNQRKLTILALALNVSEVWLMGYELPVTSRTQSVVELFGGYKSRLPLNQDAIDAAIQKALNTYDRMEEAEVMESLTIKILEAISGLNIDGRKKVLAYINDLADKYKEDMQ